MRQRKARHLAIGTGIVVMAGAVLLAAAINLGDHTRAKAVVKAESENRLSERGRTLFIDLGCAKCHSIAGTGSPRFPLDGIGSRVPRSELANWITAPPEMKNRLPRWAFEAKQSYRELDPADLEALLAYLSSSRS